MTEPSKHKPGRRRAEPSDAAHKPVHKPAGGARVKAPDQVRRNQPSRLAWARTTWGQVAIGAGVLLLALVLRIVVTGGDDETENQTPVGAAPSTFGTDWKTKDGHSYSITVTPIAQLDSSTSDCVLAPSAGRTNLRFTVRIDNNGTDPAPVPEVLFAVNLKPSGAVSRSTSFTKASRHISISPTSVTDCADAAQLPAGGAIIAAKSAATFSGLIGGVRTPVGAGVALIVRYTQADAGSPTGSGTADVIVQFPAISS